MQYDAQEDDSDYDDNDDYDQFYMFHREDGPAYYQENRKYWYKFGVMDQEKSSLSKKF